MVVQIYHPQPVTQRSHAPDRVASCIFRARWFSLRSIPQPPPSSLAAGPASEGVGEVEGEGAGEAGEAGETEEVFMERVEDSGFTNRDEGAGDGGRCAVRDEGQGKGT